jgi:hypothetical protein
MGYLEISGELGVSVKTVETDRIWFFARRASSALRG